MRNKPRIRFKGFTEDWEQCKLGSLATVEMNKRIFKEQTTTKGDIPFYKIGTFGSDADSFISRDLFEEYKNKYPYPNIGDILISASGSIGRTVVYNGEDAYYQDSNIVWLNHNGKIDNSFLLQFYNQVKWAGLEGSTIKRLYNKNILETYIAVPKIEEQRLIGEFFKLVDSSITLHQRKLEKLKLAKKALLQKLFPKNGSQFPEIRFKGFTDAWEQRKLGEVVKSYSGGTPTASNKEYYGGDIPFIRSAEINSDATELYITQKGLDNSSAKIVEKGTILYAMYGATSGEVGISKINGAINQAILAMIPLNYDGKIIAQYLRKNKESIIGKYLQGGQGNLSANIILELPIQLPGLEESNQIAYFLESVDNIITLHQRKLDHLISIKKGLLQQLFV